MTRATPTGPLDSLYGQSDRGARSCGSISNGETTLRQDMHHTGVLRDINMPVMGGFEFLEKVAELEPRLSSTVLVRLSSSDDARDRARAGELELVRLALSSASCWTV